MSFEIKKLADAIPEKVENGRVISPARPALYEVIMLVPAVDREGKEIEIKGQKIVVTEEHVNRQIAMIGAELAKWNSIKASILQNK
jgi:hypothetical protein